MKLTKKIIALCIGMSFCASVSANEINPIGNPSQETPLKADVNTPPAPLAITPDLVEKKDVKTDEEVKGEKQEKKEEKKKYAVSKSTLYNQLAYDFGKKGYKVVWNLKFDPSFTPDTYKTIEDQMVYAINRLNEVWNGNFDDGNKVQGLICPQNKVVYFVFSNEASKVVDKDGVSCDLITPLENNKGQSYSGTQAPINPHNGNNYYETGNILSGPMIVER